MSEINNNIDIYLNKEVNTEHNKKYTIKEFMSAGGNGYVFECIDEQGESYVLKLLYTTSSIKIENFKKEIELQKSFNSEYIVKCIDSGEHRFGTQRKARPFYIMKKYDFSLEELINDNRITPLKAYKYSLQLCNAIKVLHKHIEPIIHRDLKPENILYDKKKDIVLVSDFGLAHMNINQKTINEGFVGNIDYHAPEQKKRGKNKVGKYTDIYSLGLIINVLFTKEIAQGEDYKKIWQVAPYFSFVDDIVDRMIRHDILLREDDINSIIMDLEKYDMEYEVTESFLKVLYKNKKLSKNGLADLINLLSLLNYSIHNKMNWEEINLNYYCDYHFSCADILKNSVLLNCYYNVIKNKFEHEGKAYKKNSIPYAPIDLTFDDNKKIFNSFTINIDSMQVLPEMERIKNIIKKYFISLCDYHVKEIFSELNRKEKEVNEYCVDAPILCISFFLSNNLKDYYHWDYEITNHIIFDKYEYSNVKNKRKFSLDINYKLKKIILLIKEKIEGTICTIKEKRIQICFENFEDEEEFENLVIEIAKRYQEYDPIHHELLDIINQDNYIGFKKLYILDEYDAEVIFNNLK